MIKLLFRILDSEKLEPVILEKFLNKSVGIKLLMLSSGYQELPDSSLQTRRGRETWRASLLVSSAASPYSWNSGLSLRQSWF